MRSAPSNAAGAADINSKVERFIAEVALGALSFLWAQ
jgi:hypothetical protein